MNLVTNFLKRYFTNPDLTITGLPHIPLKKINEFILDKKPFALTCKMFYNYYHEGQTRLKSVQSCPFTTLPSDVYPIIFSNLPLKDKIAFSSTCTVYNDFTSQLTLDQFIYSLKNQLRFIKKKTNLPLYKIYLQLIRFSKDICSENHKPLSRVIHEIKECNTRLFFLFYSTLNQHHIELGQSENCKNDTDAITKTNWTILSFYMAKMRAQIGIHQRRQDPTYAKLKENDHKVFTKLLNDATTQLDTFDLSLLIHEVVCINGDKCEYISFLGEDILSHFFQQLLHKGKFQLVADLLGSLVELMIPKFDEVTLEDILECLKKMYRINNANEQHTRASVRKLMDDDQIKMKSIAYDLLLASLILNTLDHIRPDDLPQRIYRNYRVNDETKKSILDCKSEISKISSSEIKTPLIKRIVYDFLGHVYGITFENETLKWMLNFTFILIDKIEDKTTRMKLIDSEIYTCGDHLRTIEKECVNRLPEHLKKEWLERKKATLEHKIGAVYNLLADNMKKATCLLYKKS